MPNLTAVVAPVCVKALPLTWTDVPPASGPLPGAIFVIVGLATYVNVVVPVESGPLDGWSRTVTVTSPGAAAAGDVIISEVSEAGVTVVGEPPPNATVRVPAPEKPQPVIVAAVPPVTKPTAGEISVTPKPLQVAALDELPCRPMPASRIASTEATERAFGDVHPFVAVHIGWHRALADRVAVGFGVEVVGPLVLTGGQGVVAPREIHVRVAVDLLACGQLVDERGRHDVAHRLEVATL